VPSDFEEWMAAKGDEELRAMMVLENEHTARRVRLLMEFAFVGGGDSVLGPPKAPEEKR
jgi:hypothetical protein